MKIAHHPDRATLMSYAAGSLDEAFATVVATHLASCAECRSRLRETEEIGGNLLEAIDAVPLDAAAFERAMRRLNEPVEQTGPFEYRLSGNVAIHDWADVLGIDLAETRMVTIGGLVTALLGKMPKNGDIAYLKNLKFTVEKVRKRRIETLVLTLEPFQTNGQ